MRHASSGIDAAAAVQSGHFCSGAGRRGSSSGNTSSTAGRDNSGCGMPAAGLAAAVGGNGLNASLQPPHLNFTTLNRITPGGTRGQQ